MWNSYGGFEGGYGGASMGGGYMQSPGGFGSPTATQGGDKSRSRSQQIVPCTVSQLLSASQTGEVFAVGEVELSQVVVMGIIRHTEKAPTNILYKLDDMTAAPMDVRQWVDTDEAGSENIVVPPENYVKVVGHLRSFQNKRSLVAFKVVPLEDMNELTAHMLEVVHCHMTLNMAQGTVSAGGAPLAPSVPARSGMGEIGSSDMQVNGLTPHQSQVLNLIRSYRGSEGMSFDELKKRLHGLNVHTIKQAVEFLSNEGHIYSTVDEDHFKSTDAD